MDIIDEVLTSSTRFYASQTVLDNPATKSAVDNLVLMMASVLEARSRVLMEMNVAKDNLDEVLAALPSMRQPTVGQLSNEGWFAVRSAILRKDVTEIIPKLKAAGACDIIMTRAEQIIA